MVSLPPTSPHGTGLLIAVIGFILLATVGKRDSVRQRLGSMYSGVIIVLSLALLTTGVLYNGVYGTAARGVFMLRLLPSDRQIAETTVKVALSKEFLRYDQSLQKQKGSINAAKLEKHLTVSAIPYSVAQQQLGIQIVPHPPLSKPLLVYQYYRATPIFLHYLGVGNSIRQREYRFVQDLSYKYFERLYALEILKSKPDPKLQKRAFLTLRSGVVYGAEWVAKELKKLSTKKLSRDSQKELATTLKVVQRYIKNPSLRGK